MVNIHPFRAIRYRATPDNTWADVISPPYDVINPEEQEKLYAGSAHNVVRLILGKAQPTDSAADNWYLRARNDFENWQRSGVLARDSAPALYLIEHRFTSEGKPQARLGVTALLELNDQTERQVHRHEQTLSGPKADRKKLLDTIPANLESIFCIYPDDRGALEARLRAYADSKTPDSSARLKNGEEIRLWVVSDATLLRDIQEALRPHAVLIADGHHRFEVAFSQRQRYPFVMAHFVSMADEALVVHPIHRFIAAPPQDPVAKLEKLYALDPAADLDAALAWLSRQTGPGAFAGTDGRRFFGMRIRADALRDWLQAPTVSPKIAGLDVSILHGLTFSALAVPHAGIAYHADPRRISQQAAEKGKALGLFLRPIPLAQVYDLAAAGHLLPPKSTYFYPKVWSGLTINAFE